MAVMSMIWDPRLWKSDDDTRNNEEQKKILLEMVGKPIPEGSTGNLAYIARAGKKA